MEKTKILTDEEYELLTRVVKEFVSKVALQFGLTVEDALWKIEREINLMKVR